MPAGGRWSVARRGCGGMDRCWRRRRDRSCSRGKRRFRPKPPRCSPADVLDLLKRVAELPGFAGFTYRDERGERCPTGEARDERYHVPFDLDAGHGRWRIDLSVWLRDLHGHVAAWHERLRETIDDEQRLAALRIKDVWHRLPSYPDEVGGFEVYSAMLRDGVRTPEEFGRWLTSNGFPGSDGPGMGDHAS